MKTSVRDIELITLKKICSDEGSLVAIESFKDIPIPVSRIFYVYGTDNTNRGNHAHFRARQCLVCINGEVIVSCNDGDNEISFSLDSPDKLLYIPEMIWDSIDYIGSNTILLVMSDMMYEKEDYISDFEKFKNIKKINLTI